MKLYLDGRGFSIEGLTKDNIKTLLKMIDGASLENRREFYRMKHQIEYFEKCGII